MNARHTIRRWWGLAALVCWLAPSAALAAWTMPVQGVLTDAEGTPIDGFVEASFALYTAEGDTVPLWAELVTLDVRDGAFTTYLGATAPVMPQLEAANGPLWLGVALDGGTEMGRVSLGAVPYAARAAVAETVGIHEHAANSVSGVVPAGQSCPAGQVLTGFDASGQLICTPGGGGATTGYALSGTSCALGQMMVGIDANGYPLCSAAPSGGGTGLSTQSCASDEIVTGVLSNGSLECTEIEDLEILTGDGTSKRLVKFTGDHTVDDSMITDTGTKVGINQTSPQKTLDVKGDLKVSGDFLWGGSAFTSSSCVVMGGNSCSSACSQHGMSCTKA
ncbi:MAG: hypothetical protein QF464_15560, partial [Myxococcota bacterium]|nr:hypothetical protein [Myxococcota bacterium]